MTLVRERFRPKLMAADATQEVKGPSLGGFLCKTTGTITVSYIDAAGSTIKMVDAVPVTAGVYTPIPILSPNKVGYTVVLASGASGTLMV